MNRTRLKQIVIRVSEEELAQITGHYFTKWNTKADGSGTSYDGEETVLNMTDKDGKEIDLYTQWDVDTYFSIFYLGGGYMKDGAERHRHRK